MKAENNKTLYKGEWINLEKFIINFMDGSEQECIVHPMSIDRYKREAREDTSPVFEVANCIYYKDKIKSIQF